MKTLWILLLGFALCAGQAFADVPNGGEDDSRFLTAEILAPEGDGADASGLDESGWDGRVEWLDAVSLDQYAAGEEVYSRIEAVAAVEPRVKCKPEKGIASWYGGSLDGGPTASGERFHTHNRIDMTAAHKTLPLGTRVRVTNRKNGLSVIVRINDRGPFVPGRVIDVSSAAAKALHLDGVGPVQLNCV